MIYLATPYSHPDPSIQELRYEKACELTHILVNNSVPCYSPIAFWHPISLRFSLPGDHGFWSVQDSAAMRGCSELWVVKLEGWSRSRGVAHEMNQWQDAKNLYLIDEHELEGLCQQYHERRNAVVLGQMNTATAAGGFGLAPIAVEAVPVKTTIEQQELLDVFGPPL